ncbi:MAG TPA: putative sulfate/molybdate transporter [Bryobacteraceae bacterium]|nr:putative sulfate/molybdate transporter [Bryobacteraceae bacterium]
MSAAPTVSSPRKPALRFGRNEWSGAFGDMGTDLPLLVGVILAARLDPASALILFGAMQILTGVVYRMPMAVQPLKAMAALVIAQKLPAATLLGGGLAIGLTMLFLSLSGLIEWIARAVPKPVVRGIQLGLGLQLAGIALREYMRADGKAGLVLAAAGFVVAVALMGRRRVPAAVVLVLMGAAYAFAFRLGPEVLAHAAGFGLPRLHIPSWSEIWAGFLLLALPQLPLSIANSVLATRQIVEDFFPERRLTARRIALTYSAMNLINPFFGGVPTCHGSGGLAGHYAFGGRTGGSVVIYGSLYLILGFFFSPGFDQVIRVFPMPVLGVLLLFEGLTMAALVRDLSNDRPSFVIAVLVGLVAVYLPYGYVVGLLVGAVLVPLSRRGWIRL